MIVVLKGADFSENNLGQVYVNPVIDPFTDAAISASGNTSMTNAQRGALNTFFKQLGAFGDASQIWSKLDKVYIPMIAGSVEKSCYDYVESVYDAEPTSTSWQLRDNGLVGKLSSMPTTGDDCLLTTENTFLPKMADLSVYVLPAENMNSGVTYIMNYAGNSGSNSFSVNFRSTGNGGTNFCISASSPSSNLLQGVRTSYLEKGVLVGGTIRGSGDISFLQADGTLDKSRSWASVDNFSNLDTSGSYAPFTSETGAGNATERTSLGLVVIGKAITDAEIGILRDSANTLASYFLQ